MKKLTYRFITTILVVLLCFNSIFPIVVYADVPETKADVNTLMKSFIDYFLDKQTNYGYGSYDDPVNLPDEEKSNLISQIQENINDMILAGLDESLFEDAGWYINNYSSMQTNETNQTGTSDEDKYYEVDGISRFFRYSIRFFNICI